MPQRAIYYLSALLVGLGIGVFTYRFAILGVFWGQGAGRWIFVAVGTGLVAAGFKLHSFDPETERPAIATRIAIAIVGIGAAMGLLFQMVPSLSRISLERRQLPGFSLELPKAKPDVEVRDYNTGTITWKQVGGANAVLSVMWQGGPASLEDLRLGIQAIANEVGGGSPTHLTLPGPNNTQVDTLVVDTNKKVPLRMSALPCGKRAVIIMSMGTKGSETVHARTLKSFVCTPDATMESLEPGTVRVALSLPGWYVDEKEHGQVTLTDGTAILILREISASATTIEQIVVPMLNAFGGEFRAKPSVGDRVPFAGTVEGEPIEGWARRVVCPTHHVLVLGMASTATDAEAAYVASSSAGCLRPGEAPPTWPPAVEESGETAPGDEAAPAEAAPAE